MREKVGDIKDKVLELDYAFMETFLGVEKMLGGSRWEQGGGCIGLEGRLGVMDFIAVGGDALITGEDVRS